MNLTCASHVIAVKNTLKHIKIYNYETKPAWLKSHFFSFYFIFKIHFKALKTFSLLQNMHCVTLTNIPNQIKTLKKQFTISKHAYNAHWIHIMTICSWGKHKLSLLMLQNINILTKSLFFTFVLTSSYTSIILILVCISIIRKKIYMCVASDVFISL